MNKYHASHGHRERRLVAVEDIHIRDKVIKRLLSRDYHQIDAMRASFEEGRDEVEVVLHPRVGGGFSVEDGRHRVIAAILAGVGVVEAEIVA